MSRELAVFARAPEFGKVKTRLAAGIGNAAAFGVYTYLLERLWNELKDVDFGVNLFSVGSWPEEFSIPETKSMYPQPAGDLGERMHSAFELLFLQDASKVVLVGTDIPDLNGEILNSAFQMLQECDVVLGPVSDGGYYLIGLNSPQAGLFREMRWSVPDVFSKTLERCAQLGLRVSFVPELNDIDDEEDLRRSSIYPWFNLTFADREK